MTRLYDQSQKETSCCSQPSLETRCNVKIMSAHSSSAWAKFARIHVKMENYKCVPCALPLRLPIILSKRCWRLTSRHCVHLLKRLNQSSMAADTYGSMMSVMQKTRTESSHKNWIYSLMSRSLSKFGRINHLNQMVIWTSIWCKSESCMCLCVNGAGFCLLHTQSAWFSVWRLNEDINTSTISPKLIKTSILPFSFE